MDTRCPRLRSVRATWGTTCSYSLEFSSSLSRYVSTVIFMRSVLSGSGRSLGKPHAPAPQREGQPAIPHQLIVEPAGTVPRAFPRRIRVSQPQELAPANRIAQLVRRPRTVPPHLGLRAGALDGKVLDHVVNRFRG